jgi:hypothetical protein
VIDQKVDGKQNLEEITQILQRDASFYYCLLSEEVSGQPNISLIISTINKLDNLGKKLAEAYIVKAAYLTDEHFNKLRIQKTEDEHWKEINSENALMEFAAGLNPEIRLQKQHSIKYIFPYQSGKKLQTAGLYIKARFPEETVYYINKALDDVIMFNQLTKSEE